MVAAGAFVLVGEGADLLAAAAVFVGAVAVGVVATVAAVDSDGAGVAEAVAVTVCVTTTVAGSGWVVGLAEHAAASAAARAVTVIGPAEPGRVSRGRPCTTLTLRAAR